MNFLIHRKQDPTTEDRPAQPHRRPAPETSDPRIDPDGSGSVHGARTFCTLAPRLDRVEGHGQIRRRDTRDHSVGEIGRDRLRDVARGLEIFEDVVRPEADRGRGSLFQRVPREAAVDAQDQAVFGEDGADGVDWGMEAFGASGIVDQCGLDPFRWRHRQEGRDDSRGHAGKDIADRCQGTGLWILEQVLDVVEGDETDGIFGNGTDDLRRAAFVQGTDAFGSVDSADDKERVFGCWNPFLVPQLDTSLRKFKGILSLFHEPTSS